MAQNLQASVRELKMKKSFTFQHKKKSEPGSKSYWKNMWNDFKAVRQRRPHNLIGLDNLQGRVLLPNQGVLVDSVVLLDSYPERLRKENLLL